jgi:hypothetical protein
LVKEDRERDAPIAICLKYFPDGARYLDAEGSLPLHCAVRTGKGWIEGVKQLISVEPMALQSRDGVYGMYPFMLAAMEDNNTLDMVFRLLQANPSVVEGGIFTRCSLQMKQYASMKVDVEDCKRPTVVHNDDEDDRKPPALPSLLKKQKIERVS